MALPDKRIHGQPQYVPAISDRIRHGDVRTADAAWHTAKSLFSWETHFTRIHASAPPSLLYGCNAVRLRGRDRTRDICGENLPFLLVGLLEDTAAHHAVHFGADKHPVCLRDHDLYGACAGTALWIFSELERAIAPHSSRSPDAAADRGFSLQCLPDVQETGHGAALAH